MVTGVLTSCNRHELLQETLDSFFEMNSWPLERLIVVEDGSEVPAAMRERYADRGIEWLSTGRHVGQIAAIDYAYSRVGTPYIFHMEDDWVFYRPKFLERSMVVLEADPKCLQVWIRALDDTQRHPVGSDTYVSQGVEWRRLTFDYVHEGEWHGFSFNPGLRRLSDYVALGGYGVHARSATGEHGAQESAIGKAFRQRDFYAAILSDDDGSGYVRHGGYQRRVPAS